MKPIYLQGKGTKEALDLTLNYDQSALMRERLVEILERKIKLSMQQMRDAAKGDIVHLSEYYAEELARQQTLEDVIKLLN